MSTQQPENLTESQPHFDSQYFDKFLDSLAPVDIEARPKRIKVCILFIYLFLILIIVFFICVIHLLFDYVSDTETAAGNAKEAA